MLHFDNKYSCKIKEAAAESIEKKCASFVCFRITIRHWFRVTGLRDMEAIEKKGIVL